jgi:uncharacterized membrane protein
MKAMSGRVPRVMLAVVVVAAGFHAFYLSSVLPDRVASHFDLSGRADGWATRGMFVESYVGVVALMLLVIAGFGRVAGKIPDEYLHLPNRAYWLDPIRREATMHWIRGWSYAMCTVVIGWVIFMMFEIARENLKGSAHLGALLTWGMGVFFASIAAMLAWMIVRFAKVPG